MTDTLSKFVIGFCASVVMFAHSAIASDLSVVLHRMVGGTEIYMSGDAETLLSVFDAAEGIIPIDNGQIDFGGFRQGTWEIGDALLKNAAVTVGSAPAEFEAMSFMLHPKTDPMPLSTPLDGMIAIGVCNTISEDAQLSLSDVRAYAGYFADVDATDSPVNIKVSGLAKHALYVEVHDFGPDGHREMYALKLEAGDRIELDLEPMPVANASLFSWGAGLGFLTLSIAFGAGRLSSPV